MNDASTNKYNPIYDFLTKANSNIQNSTLSRNLYQLPYLPTFVRIPPTPPLVIFPLPPNTPSHYYRYPYLGTIS
jgi:hypothetical protein